MTCPALPGSRGMTPTVFWRLIDEARAAPDTEEAIEVRLAGFPPSEIERFQAIVNRLRNRSYRWDLWAVAYIVRGGCGDDEFDYFRGWLILQGKSIFTKALADPAAWALDFPFS